MTYAPNDVSDHSAHPPSNASVSSISKWTSVYPGLSMQWKLWSDSSGSQSIQSNPLTKTGSLWYYIKQFPFDVYMRKWNLHKQLGHHISLNNGVDTPWESLNLRECVLYSTLAIEENARYASHEQFSVYSWGVHFQKMKTLIKQCINSVWSELSLFVRTCLWYVTWRFWSECYKWVASLQEDEFEWSFSWFCSRWFKTVMITIGF